MVFLKIRNFLISLISGDDSSVSELEKMTPATFLARVETLKIGRELPHSISFLNTARLSSEMQFGK